MSASILGGGSHCETVFEAKVVAAAIPRHTRKHMLDLCPQADWCGIESSLLRFQSLLELEAHAVKLGHTTSAPQLLIEGPASPSAQEVIDKQAIEGAAVVPTASRKRPRLDDRNRPGSAIDMLTVACANFHIIVGCNAVVVCKAEIVAAEMPASMHMS